MARNGLSCADVPHSLTPTDVKADYMSHNARPRLLIKNAHG